MATTSYRQAYFDLKSEVEKSNDPVLKEFIKNQDMPKAKRQCDLSNKCGSCAHYDYDDGSGISLHYCRQFAHRIRARTDKACKLYEQRNDIEMVYEYTIGRKK